MNNDKMDSLQQMAYAIWRWDMWTLGIGSYEDIEWAEHHFLLRPYQRLGRIKSGIIKWIIGKCRAGSRDEI